MDLASVARRSATSCNLADLASQLRVTEKELRSFLIRQGRPTDFLELRESLSQDYEMQEGQYLEFMDGTSLLDSADKLAEKHVVRHAIHQRIELPDRPFLVTFWGDWHVGEAGTDHARLKEDTRLLMELRDSIGESSVVVAMGDYIGGYMKTRTPTNNAQVLAPREQREAAGALLELIHPEVVIQGDHDEWHNKHDNEYEWLPELCTREQMRFAQWGVNLELVSSGVTTRGLARHRFDGSRRANPFLPQVNLYNQWGPAEFTAVAHYHSNPGISKQRPMRVTEGSFLAVQSGTYKVFDDYGKKLGVGNGEYGVPSLLVIPEDGEIIPIESLKQAVGTAKAVCR